MISHEAAGSFYDDFQKPPGYLPLKPEDDQNQRLITPDTRHLSTPAVDLLVATTTANVRRGSDGYFQPRSVSQTQEPLPTVEQQMYAQPFLEAFNQRLRQDTASPAGSSSDVQCQSPPSITHHSFVSTTLGPNPSLASTAPTYVTATMSDINNLIPPSEVSTSYSVTSTHDPSEFPSSYMPIQTYNQAAAPEAYPALLPGFNVIAQAAPSSQGALQSQGFPSDPQSSTMSQEMLRQIVPADMKTMEYMKVERKKARNRIAASKCRLRRLQRESDLQEKVRRLKDHNQELNNELNCLREKVHNLKKVLMKHMRTGCSVDLPQGFRTDSLSSTGSEQ